MIPTDPDDREALAGEYVLGALDPETTRAVEAALATDADLAARVLAWEDRLLPAALAAAPTVEPDARLWSRIERSLALAGAAATPARLPAGRTAWPSGPLGSRLWRSAPAWRAATALATAAAILLAIFPVRGVPDLPDPPTRFLVVMQTRDAAGAEAGPGWIIRVAADGTVRSVPLAGFDPGGERALQLWTLWDPARGPVSLGVLPPGGAVRLPAESLPRIGGGQLFEITLEPRAGSPTGRPTGRILFIGRATPAGTQAL